MSKDVSDMLGSTLSKLVADKAFKAELEKEMERRIEAEVARRSRSFTVKHPGKANVTLDRPHAHFEQLVHLCSLRENVLMVGPSGGFKTTAAEMVAKALKLKFGSISLGPTITETRLFGYLNADGDYVPTPFRGIYEKGGVFLFDEFDNANPLVLNAINNALENEHTTFPDGLVRKHKDAVFLCTANTYGRGADRVYVGRSQLDASTLERFVVLDWPYDEGLERDIAHNDEWVDFVQAVRAVVDAKGVAHIVSPRASIKGAKLLEAGFSWDEVEQMVLWKGLDHDIVNSIKDALGGTMVEAPAQTKTEVAAKDDARPYDKEKIEEILRRRQI